LKKKTNETDREFIWRLGSAKEQGLIDLDWKQLTDIFNAELTELKSKDEILSESTYRQQYRIAVLYYEDVFKKKDMSEEDKKLVDLIDKKTQDLYKQQVKMQDTAREYRKHLRDDARIEVLKESIVEDTKKYDIELKEYQGELMGDKSAILCIGDWHTGALVSNFRNKYNFDIQLQRITELQNKTIEYCKNNKVKVLNVINLGDMIEGVIHNTARIESEKDAIEQVKCAARLIINLLVNLAQHIEQVTYRSVLDNHSRVTQNFKDHIEKESFCKLIDWWLEEKINNINNEAEKNGLVNRIIFEQDNIDDNLGMLEVDSYIGFFTHGHLGNKNTVVQDLTFGTNIIPDFVVMGHWHEDKVKNFQGKKVYFNGSLKGTDSYTLNKRMFSDPSQTLLICSGRDILEVPIRFSC
jgi:hypothetical protein